jgi:membrane protease YdiL (CAAX protease family)
VKSLAPSRWRLALQSYLALVAAAALGVSLAAPVLWLRARCYTEFTCVMGAMPADDTELISWAQAQPAVASFQAERRGADLWIRAEHHSPSSQPAWHKIHAQMVRLGYQFRGLGPSSMGLAGGISELITDPLALAGMLAGMQVAFCVIGLTRMRAAARRGEPLPRLFPPPHARHVGAGLLGGLALLVLGLVYEHLLNAALGHAPPSPWDAAAAMPPGTRVVFLVFGALGAPVAEEIFFRGYVLGKFRRAGCVWSGVFVSAVLFAVVHFADGYNLPCIFLYGVVLALLCVRTGSLVAPIVAHAVNNGVAIVMMVSS